MPTVPLPSTAIPIMVTTLPSVNTEDFSLGSLTMPPVIPTVTNSECSALSPLPRILFDDGASFCQPSTSSGNRKRNSNCLLLDDMRYEIEKKTQALDKKNCLLTVFTIPFDLFLAPNSKVAMILLNPHQNFPFLVIKTKPFMKGLASMFYIIVFQKTSQIIEVTKSLFKNLDGYDEKMVQTAKFHEIRLETTNFQKSVELMIKILKLF